MNQNDEPKEHNEMTIQTCKDIQQMQAMIISKYGSIKEMKLENVNIPVIEEVEVEKEKKSKRKGIVLVKNVCIGVNPSDVKIRQGFLEAMYKSIFPLILGQDSSGYVVAVSDDVERFKVGDQVMGLKRLKFSRSTARSKKKKDEMKENGADEDEEDAGFTNPMLIDTGGTYAEYTMFEEKELARKPDEMSFEVAGSMPTVGLTSYQTLFDFVNLPKVIKKEIDESAWDNYLEKKNVESLGESLDYRVLIIGGSGGVSSYMVQMIKKAIDPNIKVYAICKENNAEYVTNTIGADYAITVDSDVNKKSLGRDEKEKIWNDISGKVPEVDLVIDLVGDRMIHKIMKSTLKQRKGEYVQVGIGSENMSVMRAFKTGILVISSKVKSWFGAPSFRFFAVNPNGEQLEKVARMHIKYDFQYSVRCFNGLNNIPLVHKIIEQESNVVETKIGKQLIRRGKYVIKLLPTISQTKQQTN